MDENAGGNFIVGIIYLAVVITYIVAIWKIYGKAGRPGWNAIIPFYNVYILLKIVGRPGWWLVLFLIPFVNVFIALIIAMDLAKVFKRSTVFGVICLWLFSVVGYLILGFGKSTYTAPINPAPTTPPPVQT